MDETSARSIAGQLRKPEGNDGIRTALMMNEGNAQMNRDTIRHLAPSENDRILELGMGNGRFVSEIISLHRSIHYTGVDFSGTMIEEATRLNADAMQNGQVNFILAAAANLPFADAAFNKIFTVNTIYFWDNEMQVLQELYRVLVPGGQLIITLRPGYQMEKYPFTKYGFKLFSKEDIEKLMKAAGFLSIESFNHEEPDFKVDGKKFSMHNMVIKGIKDK